MIFHIPTVILHINENERGVMPPCRPRIGYIAKMGGYKLLAEDPARELQARPARSQVLGFSLRHLELEFVVYLR